MDAARQVAPVALDENFAKNKSKKDPLREKEFREISVEKRPFSAEICPILPMDQIRLVEKISDFHPSTKHDATRLGRLSDSTAVR